MVHGERAPEAFPFPQMQVILCYFPLIRQLLSLVIKVKEPCQKTRKVKESEGIPRKVHTHDVII